MGKRKQTTDMQKLARAVLNLKLDKEEALCRELEARGVEPSGAGALLYAQWKAAVKGDLKAAAFLWDLAGPEEAAKNAGLPELRALSDQELLGLLAACGDGSEPG
ncbi:MAG: hypothetical protein ACSW8E_02555 [Clostridia bacterium]